VAIWGIESNFGQTVGERSVIRSLATLAAGDERRRSFWRKELLQALLLVERGEVEIEHLVGSWAGAIGHTQFMPSSYAAFAVDFDGDGRKDLFNSVPDAIASTAAFLLAAGWPPGSRWGCEVFLKKGFNLSDTVDHPRRPVPDWVRSAVEPIDSTERCDLVRGEVELLLPAGVEGPAFLVGEGFRAVLRYNNSISYALSVLKFADQLEGRRAIFAPWPVDDPPITLPEVITLQRMLTALGHDVGSVDGILGSRTRRAVQRFQMRVGQQPDGYAGRRLFEGLLRATAQ
jgi:lytic murein transglycosylase